MYSLLISLTLLAGCKNQLPECPEPQLINETELPWIERDFENMYRAQISCGFKYRNCLKIWKKVSFNNYHAICGSP